MPKGKWFLEYKRDRRSTNPLRNCDREETEIIVVELGERVRSKNRALKIAKVKWDGIISQYTDGIKKYVYSEIRNPRDPQVIYRVETGFPVPSTTEDLARVDWLGKHTSKTPR